MAIYQETNLLLDMTSIFDRDAYIPKNIDFTKIIPEDYEDKEILTSFLSVVSNLVGVWLYQLDEIKAGLDPYKSGAELISNLSEIIGFPLFDEEGVSLFDKRSQLTKACESYKIKGSYSNLKGLMRAMGIVIEIKDMFANNETTYEDFEQHILKDWFTGDNPVDLTGYFKTPHFYINILLTSLYNSGIVESLWNSLQEDRLQSVVENNRPINTWPYYNLLLYFYKSYSQGSLSTTFPDIFSCYIDARPLQDFKLNAQSLETSEIVNNAGFNLYTKNGDTIIGKNSPWKLNDGLALNYSVNRERLDPRKFLLGTQNRPFVTFFDSFIGAQTDWKNHTPEVNYYGTRLFDYRNFCEVKNGYLELTPHTQEEQLSCFMDIVDQNIDISFKQWIVFYSGANYSVGINLCRSLIGDATFSGTRMMFVIDTVPSGDSYNKYFRVYAINPSGTYLEHEEVLSSMPSVTDWHDVRIVTRGLFADVYLDKTKIIDNVDVGAHLNGWKYGTYFSFIAPSIVEGGRPKIKDLQIIRLGNQDQNFNFDENTTIIRDNFTYQGYSSQLDGHVPDVSLYGKVWASSTYNWFLGNGNLLSYDMVSPQSNSFLDLGETNVKITFKFAIHKTGTQITLVGCNILQGFNSQYNEHIKVVVDRQTDPNGFLRICRYRLGLNGETTDVLIDTLASTTLVAESTVHYGDIQKMNKMEIYLTDDTIHAVLNDNWEVSLSDVKKFGNFHTRFGFYKKNSGTWGIFSALEVRRYGLENFLNTASTYSLVDDTFTGSGVLLKNHIPDVNYTGDVWHDPQDAFITGNDGTNSYLTTNTTDLSKILQNYMNIPTRDFEVEFRFIQGWPTGTEKYRVGLILFKNDTTKRGLRIYLEWQHISGGNTLTIADDYNGTSVSFPAYFNYGLLNVGHCSFRIKCERVFGDINNGLLQNYIRISAFGDYEPYVGDRRYVNFGSVNIPDSGYFSKLSVWWDPSFTVNIPVKITRLTVNPILTKSPIKSNSDRFFGSVKPLPRFSDSSGTGLLGEYFDSLDFLTLLLSRTDETINFNWGTGSPDPSISSDLFSVRWTGFIKARYSETYYFYTTSDDGIRLYVNDALIIDNWTDHASTENCGHIDLETGVSYSIRIEYYEKTGNSIVKLEWASTSQVRQVVPQECLFLPGSTLRGWRVEGVIPVNEELDKTSEVAFLAGDGKTVLGGVTYPYADKNSGEKITVSGDIDFAG